MPNINKLGGKMNKQTIFIIVVVVGCVVCCCSSLSMSSLLLFNNKSKVVNDDSVPVVKPPVGDSGGNTGGGGITPDTEPPVTKPPDTKPPTTDSSGDFTGDNVLILYKEKNYKGSGKQFKVGNYKGAGPVGSVKIKEGYYIGIAAEGATKLTKISKSEPSLGFGTGEIRLAVVKA